MYTTMEQARIICTTWLAGDEPSLEVVARLQSYGDSTKSKSRRHMLAMGLSEEYINGILPKHARVTPPVCTTFVGLTGPVKKAIATSLSLEEIPIKMEEWDPEMVVRASDAITSHYPKSVSSALILSRFRKGLEALGCGEAVVNASINTQLLNELAAMVAEILRTSVDQVDVRPSEECISK